MELLRGHFTGTFLLHFLTVAAPLATLIIVSGFVSGKAALRLLLLGVVATAATLALSSVVSTASYAQIEYGAPLPFARAALDEAAAQRIAAPTLLPANLLGDLAFWCSTTVVVGSLLRWLTLRMVFIGRRDPAGRRRSPRRRPPNLALRELQPWRRELELPARG